MLHSSQKCSFCYFTGSLVSFLWFKRGEKWGGVMWVRNCVLLVKLIANRTGNLHFDDPKVLIACKASFKELGKILLLPLTYCVRFCVRTF